MLAVPVNITHFYKRENTRNFVWNIFIYLLIAFFVCVVALLDIPYSAKFSRHLYFVDLPLKAVLLHNIRGITAYRKPRL